MNETRRGVVLLETVVAAALLAVLISVSVQLLLSMAVARRAAEARAIALVEAANIVERASALPWDQITAERVAEIKLDPLVAKMLPEAALHLSVESNSEGPPAKQIRAEVSWHSPAGNVEAPVRLNGWVYANPRTNAVPVSAPPEAGL